MWKTFSSHLENQMQLNLWRIKNLQQRWWNHVIWEFMDSISSGEEVLYFHKQCKLCRVVTVQRWNLKLSFATNEVLNLNGISHGIFHIQYIVYYWDFLKGPWLFWFILTCTIIKTLSTFHVTMLLKYANCCPENNITCHEFYCFYPHTQLTHTAAHPSPIVSIYFLRTSTLMSTNV